MDITGLARMLSITAALSWGGAAFADESPVAPHSEGGDSTTVEIVLENARGDGVRFAVPPAYLHRRYKPSGRVDLLFLYVMIPDLEPEPVLTAREAFEMSGLGSKSTVPSRSPDGPVDPRYGGSIVVSATIPGAFERIMQREVFGASRYMEPSEPEFVHFRTKTRERLVLKDELRSPRIWFDCFPLSHPLRLCDAHAQLGDRLRFNYTIRRSEVRRWRELDMRVRAFVTDLIVDCFTKGAGTSGPTTRYACQFQ
jgi:hypothetical protein